MKNKKSFSTVHFPPKPRKKKALGQHFLRQQSIVDTMINSVAVTNNHTVLEIGCGDGFLTRSILNQTACKALWCYEIDAEWADHVQKQLPNPRLKMHHQNVLDIDIEPLRAQGSWMVLANLPYCVTFPILKLFQRHKDLFREGVVMVQEEVANRVVAQKGKAYGPISLFLQHHFTWKKLVKVPPKAFSPPPKVDSRLLHFKVKEDLPVIAREDEFWQFVKQLFRMPRRTIHNNLRTTHYPYATLSETLLSKRAQELSFDEILLLWEVCSEHEQD